MSYLLDRKNKKKRYLKIALAAVILGLMFYFRSGIFNGFSTVASGIFGPVIKAGNGTFSSLGGLKAYLSTKTRLAKENEDLRRALLERDTELMNYDAVVAENEDLKETLNRIPKGRDMVLAAILSKPNRSPYDTLVLDAGSEEGIRTGNVVFAEGNIPIGRVDVVDARTSRAVLFSSAGEKTQVIIPSSARSDTNIFWEVVGRGGGNFEMILPRDFALEKGDETVMPGIRTYAVAVTETILSDPRDPFKKALLKSPVNIQDLRFVQIEIK